MDRDCAGSYEGEKGPLSSGQECAQRPLLWRDHLLKEKRLVEVTTPQLAVCGFPRLAADTCKAASNHDLLCRLASLVLLALQA